MMFYKKTQQKINGLWYPRSITWGKAITTNQVADQLALLSTVTRGDAYAIMKNFGTVLSLYMGQGRSVKIDGVGTFYYTAAANKQGVQTAKEVSASQIVGVRVRFIPEVERDVNNKVVTRSMVDNKICWEEWGKTSGNESGNTGGAGDENDNPLG
ncbi:HU family DNA-binding protein [uncultured Bacteroides sp.]|uniref:HU family DNA-binding protein n=1 Tax=uncultured Bacteroides sp. TaxID=162156 RepID=UPI0025F3CE7E|nr:HU family DNA-binding protein [uncultured Bacteroides sp.]